MKRLLVGLLAATAIVSAPARADFLGLYAGAGLWNHDPSGGFQSNRPGPNDNISLGDTLSMSDESEGYAYIALDHPIPLLPNIMLAQTRLTHEGNTPSIVNFNAGVTSGSAVASLDSADLTLYWRLLDNWVNFDVGLTLRRFDGEFSIGSQSIEVTETIPMVYAAAQFDMPFTGLSIGGDINLVEYDDNSLSDIRLRLLYEFGVVGLEGGMRSITIELDDVDNITTDISFDGLYVGAFLHF